MKRIFLIFTFLLALLPALFHFHIVKKDFFGLLTVADGIVRGHGYCFQEHNAYANLPQFTGLSARPPLVPLLLVASFQIFGHNLLAIYFTWLLPRLLIYPLLFFIARRFFPDKIAYLVATLPLFFPFFETYALATLKADVFVVALSLMSLYFSLKWLKEKTNKNLVLTSVFLSLSALTKETAPLFSATLGAIIGFKLLLSRGKSKQRSFLLYILPPILIIGPLIVLSLLKTGRLFPSLVATNLSSFPQNIITYIFSVPYYSGINFSLSRTITITSIIRLAILVAGIIVIIRRRLFELILPVFAVLFGLSTLDTKVVQGDSIGDVEILHRIALVVPFVSLYYAFGLQAIVTELFKKFSLKKRQLIFFVCLLLLVLNYLQRYFAAPYALDYAREEFYLNSGTILKDQTPLPLTTFKITNNLCIIDTVPANEFLFDHYQQYKTSAFPPHYDKLITGMWLIPIITSVF